MRNIKSLARDRLGMADLDPGRWAYMIIILVVVILIVTALFPTLLTALAGFAENETTTGPIVEVLVPLLIGFGLLLAIVAVVFSMVGKKGL